MGIRRDVIEVFETTEASIVPCYDTIKHTEGTKVSTLTNKAYL